MTDLSQKKSRNYLFKPEKTRMTDLNKDNNKITELRTILQSESQNPSQDHHSFPVVD
jgi:hypothetical protein